MIKEADFTVLGEDLFISFFLVDALYHLQSCAFREVEAWPGQPLFLVLGQRLSQVLSGRSQACVWLLGEENGYRDHFGSRYFSLLGIWAKDGGIPKSWPRPTTLPFKRFLVSSVSVTVP